MTILKQINDPSPSIILYLQFSNDYIHNNNSYTKKLNVKIATNVCLDACIYSKYKDGGHIDVWDHG